MEKVNILLVGGSSEHLLDVAHILESLRENLVQASSQADALRCVETQDFALILVAIPMQATDAIQLIARLKQHKRAHDVPILFLTTPDVDLTGVLSAYPIGS